MDLEYQQHISQLILFYLKGELSSSQLQELEAWRVESPRHEEMFQRMVSMENFSNQVKCYVKDRQEQEKEWKAIRKRTLAKEKKLWIWRWKKYAAVLLLPLIAGTLWCVLREYDAGKEVEKKFFPGNSSAILVLSDGLEVNLEDKDASAAVSGLKEGIMAGSNQLNYQGNAIQGLQGNHTLKVPRGAEYTLILADGSKVFLNAESQIQYPVTFQGNVRQVYLEGEAYFEIEKDQERPFIVATSGIQLKVLGTAFAVRAYSEENEVLATLVEGRVRVVAGDQQVDLLPNEQAAWEKTTEELRIAEVNVDLFMGWKEGRLVFDNTPLAQILKELGRWYDLEIEYENLNLKLLPFSLDMEKYADFRQVLRLLEQTGRVKFSVSGSHIIVK